LLIKNAESTHNKNGFAAMDMDLLRKCPCPVWLSQSSSQSSTPPSCIQIAVAVDPDGSSEAEHDLAVVLLQLSKSIADHYGTQLRIVSCWDFPFGEFLYGHPFARIPQEEIARAAFEVEKHHKSQLDTLIHKAGIEGNFSVVHRRGVPEKVIPVFVKDNEIDLLVMGTLARTGIPGFIMGNTAENIVQALRCSLLALKPKGFISPVAAY
jgi:nucleotide-binding universal stress UspA family protein